MLARRFLRLTLRLNNLLYFPALLFRRSRQEALSRFNDGTFRSMARRAVVMDATGYSLASGNSPRTMQSADSAW